MPAFLAPLAAKAATWLGGATAKLILIASILAMLGAAYWYVDHLESQVAVLSKTAADAKSASDANAAQYADLKQKTDHLAAVISELEAEKVARQAALIKGRDQVTKAASQPGGDAPIAPALRSALDVIRSQP